MSKEESRALQQAELLRQVFSDMEELDVEAGEDLIIATLRGAGLSEEEIQEDMKAIREGSEDF